jgi:hypothetical protein
MLERRLLILEERTVWIVDDILVSHRRIIEAVGCVLCSYSSLSTIDIEIASEMGRSYVCSTWSI